MRRVQKEEKENMFCKLENLFFFLLFFFINPFPLHFQEEF